MRRTLYSYRFVTGDIDTLEPSLLSRLPELLAEASGSPAPKEVAVDGTFLLTLHHRAGSGLAKQVRVWTGVAHRSKARLIVPVRWTAEPSGALFPTFEGALELEPLSAHASQIAVTGTYTAPLGPIGAAIDRAVLRRVAEETVEAIAAGLAEALAGDGSRVIVSGDAPRSDRDGIAGQRLRVRHVMTPDPVVLDAGMSLRNAAHVLFRMSVSGAPVVRDDGALVGVLSERDLLVKEATWRYGFGKAVREEERRRDARTVEQACATPAITTVPDALLQEATRLMLDRDVSRLVVVEESRVCGILTRHDVLAALVRDEDQIVEDVRAILRTHDSRAVPVEIDNGVVRLTGTAPLRSTVNRLPDFIGRIEGVMAVETEELRWQDNDVMPLATPYL